MRFSGIAEPTSAAASTSRIDRSSSIPFYHQLKEILRAQVVHGPMGSGDRLESEHALCERHGVSRTVVRQALADLELEGLLVRRKGLGTFVAATRTSQGLVQSLNGLWEDVHAMGRTLRSEVRRLHVVPADHDVARRLELRPESPVVELERLRFIDGEPWVSTISHVPHSVAPDLTEQDLTEQSLYLLLRDRYDQPIVRSHRMVEARAADSQLARDLQISAGDPVLALTTVSYNKDDVAMETFIAFHRADRSRFEVNLTRADEGTSVGPIIRMV